MSDLAWIERNYGCIAEYNRCMEENNSEDFAREMKNMEACARNKAKLNEAGDRARHFCYECVGCKWYEDIGPTSYGSCLEDIDDVIHGICHHQGKPYLEETEESCKGKEI